MNWMDDLISRCLEDVPPGKYRARTERELRDHMETQCSALTGAGMPLQEAQAQVLHTMGDPDRLRREYAAAWDRRPLARAGNLLGCWMAMGVLYALSGVLAFWLFLLLADTGLDLALLSVALYALLFLIPAPAGAALLRYCFQKERCPAFWVTLGLLIDWAAERAAVFSTGLYDLAPTFRPAYLALTFVGCLVLGQLFGRNAERSRELI